MTPDEARQELVKKGFVARHIDWWIRAGFKCEYCGRDLLASFDDYDSWQMDHIYPQSKQQVEGGLKGLNIALACKTCNFRKRAKVYGQLPTSEEERSEMVEKVKLEIAQIRAEREIFVAELRQLAQVLLDDAKAKKSAGPYA